jgi:hypothetical protein
MSKGARKPKASSTMPFPAATSEFTEKSIGSRFPCVRNGAMFAPKPLPPVPKSGPFSMPPSTPPIRQCSVLHPRRGKQPHE